MSAPATPTTFNVQTGDGKNFLSWDVMATATSYIVSSSNDGVTFTTLATITGTPLHNFYLDASPTTATKIYYQVASSSTGGTSLPTVPISVVPAPTGQVSLLWLRTLAQMRADMVNGQFISTTEWNSYLTNSYKELYDLLAQKFGDDYFAGSTYTYTTDGASIMYPLPTDFRSLIGAEINLNAGDPTAWVDLKKFEFKERNKFSAPNVFTLYGVTNIRYRLNGSNLMIMPVASANQTIRIWYVPRPKTLMADTDILDGISGWEDYVVVDTARKARQKEETDTSELVAEKASLVKRIEEAAENRDVGEPERVTDATAANGVWGDYGDGGSGYGNGW